MAAPGGITTRANRPFQVDRGSASFLGYGVWPKGSDHDRCGEALRRPLVPAQFAASRAAPPTDDRAPKEGGLSPRGEYARKLGLLTGDAFEAEVVTAFQQTLSGFQRVPDKPHGDGGLDGISHGFTHAYCCYGLELQPAPGTLTAALRKKIVRKFKDDLLRLFELKRVRGAMKDCENTVLPKVLGLPKITTKFKVIRLIANVFEDNQLIGDLRTAFEMFRKASKRRFIAADCELTIWGPVDVANNTAVSEQFLLRVEHPALFDVLRIVTAAVDTHEPADQDKFNAKFDDLASRLPLARAAGIESLRATFKRAWSRSILLNERLSGTLPNLHQQVEGARARAATDALIASSKANSDPLDLLEKSREGLRQQLVELVKGGLPPDVRDDLADAETGRLIGECPLDWRSVS